MTTLFDQPAATASTSASASTSLHSQLKLHGLSKLKHDSQLNLDTIKNKIYKLQIRIPELELDLNDLDSQLKASKSKFESLEFQIKNLDVTKRDKINKLNSNFKNFKSLLDLHLNTFIDQSNVEMDQKIKLFQISMDAKDVEFKNLRNSITDKIKVLKNSLTDYSDKILNESKSKIENDLNMEISEFINLEKKNIDKMTENLQDFKLTIIEVNTKIDSLNSIYDNEVNPKLTSLKTSLNNINNELDSTHKTESNLNNQLNNLNKSNQLECDKLLNLKERYRNFNDDIKNFNLLIKEEEQHRRFLHNQLQEMKGNIRVFCRIKPDISSTFNYKIQSLYESSDLKESIIIDEPVKDNLNTLKKSSKTYKFSFDKIFDKSSSNGDIFEEISQLVQSSIDGFNVCIFTYGQTGSGKTFTMSNSNDGLIPRSLNLMFERISLLSSTLNENYQLFGQFFEIYGDNIRDLIDDHFHHNNDNNNNKGMNGILPTSEIDNIKMIQLKSIEQINILLNHANEKRITASTMANDESSRSHSIFKVNISKFNKHLNEFVILGKLNLIDLAGSERLAHSQVQGLRLKETLSINKSLSALGDVISSLKSKSSHIPYRNSKLTYILKDSLGGDSKTLMFVNISCLNSSFNESLSSLRFASKVNNTTINK